MLKSLQIRQFNAELPGTSIIKPRLTLVLNALQKRLMRPIALRQAEQTWMKTASPELLRVLQGNPLLGTLSRDELSHLLRNCVVIQAKPDMELTRQGELVRFVYVLLEGRAKAIMNGRGPQGGTAIVDFLEPAGDIGLLSVIDGGPHSATVIPIEPTTLLGIRIDRVRQALESHPEWYKMTTRVAVARLRNLGIWMDNLL